MLRSHEPSPRSGAGGWRGNHALKSKISTLEALANSITTCRRCERLVSYREGVARDKRRAFVDWSYWGKPLAGFGDPQARLFILGLAPAAHGGNRTGRVFTGDRSGDWLYATLHRFGFANQPTSHHRDDGLTLHDVFVSAAVRCAPPDNKPTREEFAACRPFLVREVELLSEIQVVVTLGQLAFDAYLATREAMGAPIPKPRPKFGHATVYRLSDTTLIGSYHPSQRNTQTGFLTQAMFDQVFATAREHLGGVDSFAARG